MASSAMVDRAAQSEKAAERPEAQQRRGVARVAKNAAGRGQDARADHAANHDEMTGPVAELAAVRPVQAGRWWARHRPFDCSPPGHGLYLLMVSHHHRESGGRMHPEIVSTGFSRRDLLAAGALGRFGLGLPDLLRAREINSTSRRHAKACIVLFMWGGPAQQDTWDMKPDAPDEYRGEFKPIPTTVPGLQICEHLPLLAAAGRRAVPHPLDDARRRQPHSPRRTTC